MIKQCENGHYYDADRFPVCPYCGARNMDASDDSDDVTMPLVRPSSVQSSPETNKPLPENDKTVSLQQGSGFLPSAAPIDEDDDATIPLAFYNRQTSQSPMPPIEQPEPQPSKPVMPPMEQPEPQPPMPVMPPMEQPESQPSVEETIVEEPPVSVMPPMEQPEPQPPMSVMPPMEQPESQPPMPVMPPLEQPEPQPPMPVMPPMEQPEPQPPMPVMPPMEQPEPQPPMPVMPPMEQPQMSPQPPVQQYQPQTGFPYPPLIPMQQPMQPQPIPPAPPMAPPPPMPQTGAYYGYTPNNEAEDEPTVSIAQTGHGNEPTVGWLLGLSGNITGKSFELKAGKNFIGRAPSNDVSIPDDEAIGLTRHAAVLYEPRERVFIALPSEGKELLYLNDELLVKSAQLKAYDRLKAGNTQLLFFPLCTEGFAWEDLEQEDQ